MAKKLVLSLAFFLMLIISANSQTQYGIRGGINFSSLGNNEVTFGDYKLVGEPDNYFGYHIGATSMFDVSFLYLQPELLFSSVGSFLRLEDIRDGAGIEDRVYFKQSVYKVDVPVIIGYEYGPIRFGAGPVYTMIIGSSNDYDESILNVSYEQNYNLSSLAYQVGVGLGLGNLLLDLKYEGGITSFGKDVKIGDISNPFNARPRQIILSIGLLF
ncbi:MAG: hypothetical protein ACOCWC_00950 [Bacteroidota bacterium]